jgi:hypothetical protein
MDNFGINNFIIYNDKKKDSKMEITFNEIKNKNIIIKNKKRKIQNKNDYSIELISFFGFLIGLIILKLIK